jgi:hypothetical protein
MILYLPIPIVSISHSFDLVSVFQTIFFHVNKKTPFFLYTSYKCLFLAFTTLVPYLFSKSKQSKVERVSLGKTKRVQEMGRKRKTLYRSELQTGN